jgi:hypothetical protein
MPGSAPSRRVISASTADATRAVVEAVRDALAEEDERFHYRVVTTALQGIVDVGGIVIGADGREVATSRAAITRVELPPDPPRR